MEKLKIKKWIYRGIATTLLIPITLTPILTSVAFMSKPQKIDASQELISQHTSNLNNLFLNQQNLYELTSPLKYRVEPELENSEVYKNFVRWAANTTIEEHKDSQLFINKIANLPLSLTQKQYVLRVYLNNLKNKVTDNVSHVNRPRTIATPEKDVDTSDRSYPMVKNTNISFLPGPIVPFKPKNWILDTINPNDEKNEKEEEEFEPVLYEPKFPNENLITSTGQARLQKNPQNKTFFYQTVSKIPTRNLHIYSDYEFDKEKFLPNVNKPIESNNNQSLHDYHELWNSNDFSTPATEECEYPKILYESGYENKERIKKEKSETAFDLPPLPNSSWTARQLNYHVGLRDPSLIKGLVKTDFLFPNASQLKLIYTPTQGYMIVNINPSKFVEFEIYEQNGLIKANKFLLNGDIVKIYSRSKLGETLVVSESIISGLTILEFQPTILEEISTLKNKFVYHFGSDDYASYVIHPIQNDSYAKLATVITTSKVPGYSVTKSMQKFSLMDTAVSLLKNAYVYYVVDHEGGKATMDNRAIFRSSFSTPTFKNVYGRLTSSFNHVNQNEITSENILNSFTSPTKLNSITLYAPLTKLDGRDLEYEQHLVKNYQISIYDKDNRLVKNVKEENVEEKYTKLLYDNLATEQDRINNIIEFVFSALGVAASFIGGAWGLPFFIGLAKGALTSIASILLPTALSSAISSIYGITKNQPELGLVPWGYLPSNLSKQSVLFAQGLTAAIQFLSVFKNPISSLMPFDAPLTTLFSRTANLIAREIAGFEVTKETVFLLSSIKRLANSTTLLDVFPNETTKNALPKISDLLSNYKSNSLVPDNYEFFRKLGTLSAPKENLVDQELREIYRSLKWLRESGVKIPITEKIVVPAGGRVDIKAIYGAKIGTSGPTNLFHWWWESDYRLDVENYEGKVLVEGSAQRISFSANG